MAASPGRASHVRVFTTGYLAAFLFVTLAPTLWRIARTGAAAGSDGPLLTVLLTLGTLIGAAAGAGLVLRVGRRRLSAWDAVRPRRSLLVGALAGAMTAGASESELQLAVLNALGAVLRLLGVDPGPSGLVSHAGGGVALMVKIGVSLLALAVGCGVAASLLVYFPWLAQAARVDRLGTPVEGVSADA